MARFFRFASVGLLATAIHVAIVYALVEAAGVEPVIASIPAFLAALVASYLLNRNWTFAAGESGIAGFFKYSLVALGGLLLNAVIMYVAVHVMQAHYLLGLAIVVAIVPVASFLLQRDWTFRRLGGQAD